MKTVVLVLLGLIALTDLFFVYACCKAAGDADAAAEADFERYLEEKGKKHGSESAE